MRHHQKEKSSKAPRELTRRSVLTALGVAAAAPFFARVLRAQSSEPVAPASQLPLRSTGLEHIGTLLPDVEMAGKFYGRIFNPEVHKEKAPPLRYYVTLNPGYIALGNRANVPRPMIDHFCALVENYDAAAMAQQLKGEGIPGGRFGIIPDPDALGLQLLGVPGGLAASTEPAGRIVQEEALVRPMGLDHVLVYVSDVERSTAFYRKFFGAEEPAEGKSGQVWFQVADTRLGLQKVPEGEPARIDRFSVRVESFNPKSLRRELTRLGAKVISADKKVLHFRDPFGLGVELKAI